MQVRDKMIETLKILDEESILKLYELALILGNHKKTVSASAKRFNMANIQRAQTILSSIKGSISDDIQQDREERL